MVFPNLPSPCLFPHSLSPSLLFIMFLGPRPGVSCNSNPPKITKKEQECGFLPARVEVATWQGGGGSHSFRPAGGNRLQPGHWSGHPQNTATGPQGSGGSPHPRMRGPGPAVGRTQVVTWEKAGQSVKSRLGAQADPGVIPAQWLIHVAVGEPRLHSGWAP